MPDRRYRQFANRYFQKSLSILPNWIASGAGDEFVLSVMELDANGRGFGWDGRGFVLEIP